MTELKKVTTMAWRKLLASEAGMEGMLYLREHIPSIHKGTADEMIFDAGRSEGYKQAIDVISEVIALVQQKEESADNP